MNEKYEIYLPIKNLYGLHARSSAKFSHLCNIYSCDLKVQHGEDIVNAKSLLNVLSLAVDYGRNIEIIANGEDSADAIIKVNDLFDNGIGEYQERLDNLYTIWQLSEMESRVNFLEIQSQAKSFSDTLNLNKYLLGLSPYPSKKFGLKESIGKYFQPSIKEKTLWACLYLIDKYSHVEEVREAIVEAYNREHDSTFMYSVVFERLCQKDISYSNFLIEIVEDYSKNLLTYEAICKLFGISESIRDFLNNAIISWESDRIANLAFSSHNVLLINSNSRSNWIDRFINDDNTKVRYYFIDSLVNIYSHFPEEGNDLLNILARDKIEIVRWKTCNALYKLKIDKHPIDVDKYDFLEKDPSELVRKEYERVKI